MILVLQIFFAMLLKIIFSPSDSNQLKSRNSHELWTI